jgi:CheY-like chemotaxis protein
MNRDDGGREAAGNVSKRQTILVVEDDADVLDVVVLHLTLLGYHVLTARNGPEALVMLKASPPIDLLFTDFVMPEGMSGVELAEHARRLDPGVKVLLTSGYRGRAAPCADVLPFPLLAKPYRQVELTAMIRDALGEHGCGR